MGITIPEIEPGVLSPQEILLKKIPMARGFRVPEALLDRMSIEERADFLGKHIEYQLRTFALGSEVKRHECYRDVPAGWWQHLKAELFPVWLRRRFPVKTERIYTTISHYHMCPHLDYQPRFDHLIFASHPGDCTAK